MPPKAAPRQPPPRRPNAPEGQPTGQTAANPASSQNAPAPKTEATPGPSGAAVPTRPPVQRLQSLKKSTPSGSIPRASSATPTPAGLGGAPPKPTLKYQPRAVGRRSKEEREAIEKLEAERHQERLKEAAAMQRGRGRGGPGGRGGFGRGRGGGLGADVGGPLGAGMAGRRGRGGAFGPGGGRFGPDSRASSMSRRSRSVIDRGSAAAAGGDVSSDESDSGIRVSIDRINLESDEEFDESMDEKAKGKMPVKGPVRREKGLRPIRVERHEHEERQVGVSTEASSSTSAELRRQAKEKAAQDNALFVEEEEAAPSVETEPKIKKEPTDGDEIMTDAIPHVSEVSGAITTDDEGLPEPRVRVRRDVSPKKKAKEKEVKVEKKDPRSLLRTKEEIEEYERHAHDLEVLKDLLSIEEKPPRDPEAADAKTGADDMTDTDEELVKDKHSGQLFLLQFPPMTPNLVIPGGAQEGAEATEGDVTITGATTTAAAPGGPPIKREEEGADVQEVGARPAAQEAPKLVTATEQQLPAGRVGRLHLHASGRVTLDWGGISFELDRATEVDFLQEALIASSPSTAAAAGAEGEEVKPEPDEDKRVWAMGQLSGKFVVTPDWEKILS